LKARLGRFSPVRLAHRPTRIEPLANLGRALGLDLWVKRDDLTGIGAGGNKARQLDYYAGAAIREGADTLLITGAVQSNFTAMTAAYAARLGLACHVQLEDRVPDPRPLYRENGNVVLDQLLGAEIDTFPVGEDEAAADRALREKADGVRRAGRSPYVIPLGAENPPLGALGYIEAALELREQMRALPSMDAIILASGSGLTHVGLLYGLRALGVSIPVIGICVRRCANLQRERVAARLVSLGELMGAPSKAVPGDIRLSDATLAPGYGQLNQAVRDAIKLSAQHAGLMLDPVYTGRAMAGLIELQRSDALPGPRVLFWHTGGLPALFAYSDQLV